MSKNAEKQNHPNKGFTLNQLMLVIVITSILVLLGFPLYQQMRTTIDKHALGQILTQIHTTMKDIYLEQLPNAYPPETAMATLPTSLTDWASPTNGLNVQQLLDYISNLCYTVQGNQHGTGRFDCTYSAPTVLDHQWAVTANLTRPGTVIAGCESPGTTRVISVEGDTGGQLEAAPGTPLTPPTCLSS